MSVSVLGTGCLEACNAVLLASADRLWLILGEVTRQKRSS